jgi:RNA polymerase sigma-70 factor (ECF subfamily)
MKEISVENIKENRVSQEDKRLRYENAQAKESRRRLVHEYLQRLPKKYQLILVLRDIHRHSYEEISKILKVSIGTVDSRLCRARKMLRKKLALFLN